MKKVGTICCIALALFAGVNFFDYLAFTKMQSMSTPSLPIEAESVGTYAKNMLAFWEKELERDPFNFIAVQKIAAAEMSLARSKGEETRYRRAEQLLRKAEPFTPKTDTIRLLLLGHSLLARHQFSDSLEISLKILSLAPGTAAPALLRIDALLGLGRYEEAFRYLENFHEMFPGFASWARMAELYSLQGEHEQRLNALLKARSAYAGEDAEPLAWIQAQIGIFYLERKRYDEAESAFKEALRSYPDYYLAIEHLAELAEVRGNLSAEQIFLRRTLELRRAPEYLLRMARVERALGNEETSAMLQAEALKLLEQWVEEDPAAHSRDLAEVLLERGDTSTRAMELVSIDLNQRPGDLRSHYVAARACRMLGDIECARSHIRQSLRLSNSQAEFLKESAIIKLE